MAAHEFLGRSFDPHRPKSNIVEWADLVLQPDLRLLSIAARGLPFSVENAQLVQIRKNANSTLN